MTRKPSVAKRIYVIGLITILAIAGGLTLSIETQRKKLAELTSGIARLKAEQVPIRFKIEGQENGRIQVKIKLYDMDGNELSVLKHEMEGDILFVDFACVPSDNRYLSFPKSIFTETIPPSEGLPLFPLYDNNGFPQVFDTKEMPPKLRETLTDLFSKLKQGQNGGGAFGSAVHDIKSLKSFRSGEVYRIVTRLKGGIEIIPDEE